MQVLVAVPSMVKLGRLENGLSFSWQFLTEIQLIQKNDEEYNIVLHVKMVCMLFRIHIYYIYIYNFSCNLQAMFDFSYSLFFHPGFLSSLLRWSCWRLMAKGSSSDNAWHRTQPVPSVPAPRASSLQELSSRRVVWVVTSWWQWVVNQVDKSLTSTLLWSSVSCVLKHVQVCGERLTLPAVSQSLGQI